MTLGAKRIGRRRSNPQALQEIASGHRLPRAGECPHNDVNVLCMGYSPVAMDRGLLLPCDTISALLWGVVQG